MPPTTVPPTTMPRTTMPPERAIVFDLDDTLFPEWQYAFSGFDAVSRAFADRLGPVEAVAARMRTLFGTADRRRVFDVIVAERGIREGDALVARMVEAFRGHRPAIALYSDAVSALNRLRGRCKLGLITDGFSVAQHAKIDALGLRDRLDAVIVTDDLGREFWKPHPRSFEVMADMLNVAPDACTYVADNVEKDFVAPNALGWDTVWVLRPDSVHADDPVADGGEPRRTIGSLDELK